MMKRTAAFAFAFTLAIPVVAQVPATEAPALLEEQVDVNLVLVDATVTDRRGNQILGLTKDDFVIKENGEAQEIASLDYFTNRRLLTENESVAVFKVERVREERYFILFFDKSLDLESSFGLRSELMRARAAALEFVDKEILPADKVAIVAFDVRLKVLSDFTSDRSALHAALDNILAFGPGVLVSTKPEGVSILAHLDEKTMLNDTGRIYDALKYLGKAVESIPARKVLVLFSTGVFDVDDVGSPFLGTNNPWYDPMVHALNQANVSVHAISLLQLARSNLGHSNLNRLASDTSGDFYPFVANYIVPLRKIENVNNGYYLLTYYSKRSGDKKGYQPIDVSLKNSEFRVKARQGYTY